MPDVMGLDESSLASREAADLIAMQQSPAQGWGNRARLSAHLDRDTLLVAPDPCAAGVTAESLRRFRGNVGAVSQSRFAGCVDLKDYVIALARGAGIQLVMQGRLGHQEQRVRSLLDRIGLRGRVRRAARDAGRAGRARPVLQ